MQDSSVIVETLERAAELCEDPVPLVYNRLFQMRPDFKPLFEMDTGGGMRGAMLETCFEVILGLAGDAAEQRVIVSYSRFSHTGYGVQEADFDLMFTAIRDTFRELLGAEWTAAMDRAWAGLLKEIEAIQ